MRHIIQRVDIDKSIPQWKIVCTCGYESLGATEEEAKLENRYHKVYGLERKG